MGRRANGEGTEIKEIERNGNKYYTWSISFKDVYGKTIRKTITKKVKSQVVAAKKKILEQIMNNEIFVINAKDKKITLEVWMNEWIEKYKKIKVKKSTYNNYKYKVSHYITPYLGDVYLNDINNKIVQDFITELSKNHIGSTVQDIYILFKSALKKAIELNYMRTLPKGIELPKVKQKEMNILSTEDIEKIRNNKARFRGAFLLSIMLSLRQTEVLGLTWDNINFEEKTLRVDKILNVERLDINKEGFYFDEPKTESSRRTLYLTDELVSILKENKEWQERMKKGKPRDWNKHNFVFCTCKGEFVYPSSLKMSFKYMLKKLGIDKVRFHDMRHTFCSRAIETGVDVATTMRLSGHANIRTLQRYLHPTEEAKRAAIEKISNTSKTML